MTRRHLELGARIAFYLVALATLIYIALPRCAHAQSAYESAMTGTAQLFYFGTESSGTIVNHGLSGSGYNMTTGTSPTYGQSGVNGARGTSLLFTGASSQFMHVNANDSGNGPADVGPARTMECWIKPNYQGTGSAFFSAGGTETGNSTANRNWVMFAYSSFESTFFDSNGSASYSDVTSAASLSNGTWYMLSMTWSGSTTHIHINYVNGVADGSKSTIGGSGVAGDAIQWIALGRIVGDNANYFDGNLQDCMVIPAEDSAATLLARYQLGISTGVSRRRIIQSLEDRLPRFRDDNYFGEFVRRGYVTGDVATEPQRFGPFLTFALAPRGDTGREPRRFR